MRNQQAVFISRSGAHINTEKVAQKVYGMSPEQAKSKSRVVTCIKRGQHLGYFGWVGNNPVLERHIGE